MKTSLRLHNLDPVSPEEEEPNAAPEVYYDLCVKLFLFNHQESSRKRNLLHELSVKEREKVKLVNMVR